MADSLYKFQVALRLCEDHAKKELYAYCKTCEKKICSSCIKEDHTSHDWETITDILREKKRNLPEECKAIRSKQLPDLKKELRCFDRKIDQEESRFKQNKASLNGTRQSYINKINRLFDDQVDECQQRSMSTINRYKETRDALKQKVEYLEMMSTSLDKDIDTLPDHDILDMEKAMRDELEKALIYRADKDTRTTVFVPEQMDEQVMKNMIGEMHSVFVEEINDINRYSDAVFSLKPISVTKALVRIRQDNFAKSLDRTGEEPATMKTPCFDLIMSVNGEFILSGDEKRKISVLNKDEDIITTIDTKPLHPSFISKTENDDILVTLRDSGERYNLVPTSRRIVQRMTLTGKVLHTYEFREDGKTRLFTLPTSTAENKNTDVCVVNRLSADSGELVVLHRDGRVKFIYRGDGLENEKFGPVDVECDNKCRIMLTELYSSGIHMLSAEGAYICTLCQYEQLHPTVISIHGDYLWCGFFEGRIKVLKYSN